MHDIILFLIKYLYIFYFLVVITYGNNPNYYDHGKKIHKTLFIKILNFFKKNYIHYKCITNRVYIEIF